MLLKMEKNPACNGAISRNAHDMLQSAKNHIKYFESVRKSASTHLRFLEGEGTAEDPSGDLLCASKATSPREGA